MEQVLELNESLQNLKFPQTSDEFLKKQKRIEAYRAALFLSQKKKERTKWQNSLSEIAQTK